MAIVAPGAHMSTGTNDPSGMDRFRLGKAYSVGQSAELARTTPATVRRWLMGYSVPGHRMLPVFGGQRRGSGPLVVSFLELAEIVVVARFRQATDGQGPVP